MTISAAQLYDSVANDRLHLIVMPTEKCNLRCRYCYEDFVLGHMPDPIVAGLKAFMRRRAPGLQWLHIGWFGGEPLLALDVIEDVMLQARALVYERAAFVVRSDMTTNAYMLSKSTFERLLDLGVGTFQISFDGPRDAHDTKRVRPNGEATFDRIWGNVLAMRDTTRNFTTLVRLHIDRDNMEQARIFIDEFQASFGTDARFKLFIKQLSRWGGPNDAELHVLGKDDGKQAIESLIEYATQRGARVHTPDQNNATCYASKGNSFVVRSDGRLNKCTLALEHPSNQVGRIFEDGHVEIDNRLMQGWMRGIRDDDASALHCPMHGYADLQKPATSAPVRFVAAGASRSWSL